MASDQAKISPEEMPRTEPGDRMSQRANGLTRRNGKVASESQKKKIE